MFKKIVFSHFKPRWDGPHFWTLSSRTAANRKEAKTSTNEYSDIEPGTFGEYSGRRPLSGMNRNL